MNVDNVTTDANVSAGKHFLLFVFIQLDFTKLESLTLYQSFVLLSLTRKTEMDDEDDNGFEEGGLSTFFRNKPTKLEHTSPFRSKDNTVRPRFLSHRALESCSTICRY